MVRRVRTSDVVELTFTLDRPDLDAVLVAVDARGWAPLPMRRYPRGTGPWRLTLRVDPVAEVEYRFLDPDGSWLDDPDAAERRPNPFGSHNSVVRLAGA